ncbi:hypothetical protein KC19_VG222300 [Ceratodon purpureus]|uniref:RING-type domain-containing protein n=1 Tax=Ceratodon purpureus TaxID=3225 RepID=A0A8T0HSD7_CERPU|nr:hypothetical protein KC19_VG222300 [Ceratodon purpureus]
MPGASKGDSTSPSVDLGWENECGPLNGSHSSETNLCLETRLASLEEHENPPSNCHMCKKKLSSVKLKACDHDMFCFSCIVGLTTCPICNTMTDG